MRLIVRQKGKRRLNRSVEFPLMDSQGIVVINDRRQLADRRKARYGLDDLKAILHKMAEQ